MNSSTTTPIVRPLLADFRENRHLLASVGLTSLAWLTHEAEWEDDDLTFIAIQNVLQERTSLANRIYNAEYRRLWSEHAQFRGYQRQASKTPDS